MPLNDSLSSFRLVAIAHAGAAKFGDGFATVRTTQDLMMFSGLPPLVREAGRVQRDVHAEEHDGAAGSTAARMDAARPAADETGARRCDAETGDRALAANEAKVDPVPVKVPVGVERVYWDVTARQRRRARPAAHDQKVVAGLSGAGVSGDARATRQARCDSRSSGPPARYPDAAACAWR